MCQYFREYLGPLTELTFALQTNATLIDEEWIELFSKHRVSVGISIDGPKVVNDRFRIDHKGLGTYNRTIAGLRKLQTAVRDKKMKGVAALCVINPKNNALELYQHIVHELRIQQLDFLLPDYTHHNFVDEDPEEYGRFLCDLLDAWITDDNPLIRVRILNSALSLLVGGKTHLKGFGPSSNEIEAITVSSNGDLSPDDSLRSGIPHLMN
ncbi:MAG: XyeB family radical SAM/SPASM peptide maturase, partial [Verrucomicrobiota bacterium]